MKSSRNFDSSEETEVKVQSERRKNAEIGLLQRGVGGLNIEKIRFGPSNIYISNEQVMLPIKIIGLHLPVL